VLEGRRSNARGKVRLHKSADACDATGKRFGLMVAAARVMVRHRHGRTAMMNGFCRHSRSRSRRQKAGKSKD